MSINFVLLFFVWYTKKKKVDYFYYETKLHNIIVIQFNSIILTLLLTFKISTSDPMVK